MNTARVLFLCKGLKELPDLPEFSQTGSNGESLAFDEAGVWKRVLDYRIAKYFQPVRILETHKGLGLGTALYKYASPKSEIISLTDCTKVPLDIDFDLIDIDPCGQPWTALEHVKLNKKTILMITNGEVYAVQRGLKKSLRYPTEYKGRDIPKWVVNEYLPKLEDITKMNVQFFYCFPTSVRVILSKFVMPSELFEGCQQWMWWTARYSNFEKLF